MVKAKNRWIVNVIKEWTKPILRDRARHLAGLRFAVEKLRLRDQGDEGKSAGVNALLAAGEKGRSRVLYV
jgi:hypothetical protein